MRFDIRLRSRLAALALTAGVLVGCDDLLSVDNPGAIYPEELEDPALIDLMTNGVVGEFQNFFAYTSMYSAAFTDEFRNHHVYFENKDIDLRRVGTSNGTYVIYVWNTMHRARFMSDSIASRLKNILSDSAKSDIRLARVLAYGGHTYTFMGEQLCEVPINMGPGHPPEEVFKMALPRFEEAIQVATAARARAEAAGDDALVIEADSLIAFARVGAARAALNLGNFAAAISYAEPVAATYVSPAQEGFVYWATFLENTFNLPIWDAIADGAGDGGRWLSVRNTPFDGIADPRIPLTRKRVMNDEDDALGGPLVPNSPSSYSTYNGTAQGADLTRSAWVRIASALEARYITAEAEGLTPDNLAFLNERRAIGGKAALDPSVTEEEYMAALRTERSIDFFADGHRLGDLRRYDRLYPGRADNLWQTGPYPGSTTGETYGDQTCWPVPLSELEGNPNY